MKKVKLTNSKEMATVDDEDFDLVSQFQWRLSPEGNAITTINGELWEMGCLILTYQQSMN